jgi:hypothetical protein
LLEKAFTSLGLLTARVKQISRVNIERMAGEEINVKLLKKVKISILQTLALLVFN